MTAADLMARLGISQPSLSRTLRGLGSEVTSFRVTGHRTPRYALLRRLPLGLNPRQRIYRRLSSGSIAPFAEIEFLAGGATLERGQGQTVLYAGLPPYMAFAAPSGFLGRRLAHEMSQDARVAQAFPGSLKDWGDDHHVAYLFTRGINLPGNLVFGDTCLALEMELQATPPTRSDERASHFLAMTTALKGAAYGSSAGGEQPKFLGMTEGLGHVIVKFARRGSRMADLLPLEHLALRALAVTGIPAARTALLSAGDCVFLEVQRFDRVGATGRVGMLSAGAVDDEFFGRRDTWPEFAQRCELAGYLGREDGHRIRVMAAFSELIGNSDRHFENISVLIDERGEYQGVAPAYDILPMRYAPVGAGVEPDLVPISPRIGTIGARPEVWAQALAAAERFWEAVQVEELPVPVSPAMRSLAAENLAAARAFAAPLLPVEAPAPRRPRMR